MHVDEIKRPLGSAFKPPEECNSSIFHVYFRAIYKKKKKEEDKKKRERIMSWIGG